MGRPHWRLLALLVLAIAITWWTVPMEEGPQYVLWQDAGAYGALVADMTPVVHPAWTGEPPGIVWSEEPALFGPATFVRQVRWEARTGAVEVQVVEENATRDANGTLVPGTIRVTAATGVRQGETMQDAADRLLGSMRALDPAFDPAAWVGTTPRRDDIPIAAIQGQSIDLRHFVASKGGVTTEPPALQPRAHGFPIDTTGIVVAWPDARMEVASTVWYKQTSEGLLVVDGFGRIQLSSEEHWGGRDEALAAAREAVAWAGVDVPSDARVGFLPS